MVQLLAFMTVLIKFAPASLGFYALSGPDYLSVSFEKLNGVKVGAAVVTEGQLVGAVSDIRIPESSESKTSITRYEVLLKITPRHRQLIRKGTVALIASQLTAMNTQPETVVELLVPRSERLPVLRSGEKILGYSSYEEFWSSDFTKLGMEASLFHPSQS